MSWAPNETSSEIWAERSLLAGAGIGNIAYGIHLMLFFMCFATLWRSRVWSSKSTYGMLAYITSLFILGSIGNASQMRIIQEAYIDNRNYPGGPGAYDIYDGSVLVNVLGTAAYIINAWLADGLLVYRFWVIWHASWYILLVPVMLYLLSIISSVIILVLISQPGNSLWQQTSTNFALMFWGSSISLTILLTLCIVGKLMLMRHRMHNVMGRDYKSPYTSIAAMLVESAVLYAAVALAFIITYVKNSAVNYLLVEVLGQVESIAPLLIILRVAQGRGWSRNTMAETQAAAVGDHEMQLRFVDRSGAQTGLTTLANGDVKTTKGSASSTTIFPVGSSVKVDQIVTQRRE